jgi:hypothetical protein
MKKRRFITTSYTKSNACPKRPSKGNPGASAAPRRDALLGELARYCASGNYRPHRRFGTSIARLSGAGIAGKNVRDPERWTVVAGQRGSAGHSAARLGLPAIRRLGVCSTRVHFFDGFKPAVVQGKGVGNPRSGPPANSPTNATIRHLPDIVDGISGTNNSASLGLKSEDHTLGRVGAPLYQCSARKPQVGMRHIGAVTVHERVDFGVLKCV